MVLPHRCQQSHTYTRIERVHSSVRQASQLKDLNARHFAILHQAAEVDGTHQNLYIFVTRINTLQCIASFSDATRKNTLNERSNQPMRGRLARMYVSARRM